MSIDTITETSSKLSGFMFFIDFCLDVAGSERSMASVLGSLLKRKAVVCGMCHLIMKTVARLILGGCGTCSGRIESLNDYATSVFL